MDDTIPGQSAAGRRGEAVFKKKQEALKNTVLLICTFSKMLYSKLNYKLFKSKIEQYY